MRITQKGRVMFFLRVSFITQYHIDNKFVLESCDKQHVDMENIVNSQNISIPCFIH